MQQSLKSKLVPFFLTAAVLLLDQLTKYLITRFVDPYTEIINIAGDFLRIIHARNPGIAFSIGSGLPDLVRSIFFTALPLIVLAFVLIYYFRSQDVTGLQRWSLAAIVGGGLGNLIDRIFRPEGVVDFIDVKFYGLLGFERWPTFNVADATVVVAGILLVFSLFIQDFQKKSENKD